MRLGVFGGSFDPVHVGHLRLAGCCCDQAGLDAVWFVPAAVQPFKAEGPVASDPQRCEMLRLAIASEPRFGVSTIEIDRGGVSYSVDTLRELHAARPGDQLFFLMGADTLRDLPGWREPDEVLRLATPLVVQRPGEAPPDSAVDHVLVTMPPIDISSSEVRRRLAAGEPVDGLLPPAVLEYIRQNGLYGAATG
ncbi:nicotinate-nucleotide adenylyltransferase [Botrimarina sp.]|uniref:nicotinate-nucleotide adenylyltransferase n=1 Tax=Botrimarina sp. TaxID=2795802 RepID=UPI0032EB0278